MSNKKLENLEIVKSSKIKLGPYTVAEVEDSTGAKGWGLAVKSYADRDNVILSEQIAFGRAKKALLRKINKEKTKTQDLFSR